MELTPQFLQPYFDGKKKHAGYAVTVELYQKLCIHANGEYADKLINERRPSESDEIKAYREKIFEPVTKDSFKRILTSLNKIRRSSDWSVRYEADDMPASLPEQDLPYAYTEEQFPGGYGSVTNWAFTVLLKNYLVDANAVIMVMPLNTEPEANEYLEPFPLIFNSDKVLEYKEGELVILQGESNAEFKYGHTTRYDGEVYYVITPEYIQRWEQLNSKREFILAGEYYHELGMMPAFRITADFYKTFGTQRISESKISSVVPRLNEMVREYSDLQAGVVSHLYPEAWEWETETCSNCKNSETGKSMGRVLGGKDGKELVPCPACGGSGRGAGTGPYRKMIVRGANTNIGEQAAPIPPKGYVEKNTNIIELQDKRIDKHQYAALASINMQFLLNVPLNESGYAKEVDKDELNHFVYGVAEDTVHIIDKIYQLIIEYRYRVAVPDSVKRNAMLPAISVPEKYDLLSLTYLLEELTKAIAAKVSPAIIITMLKEYVSKKFYNNPQLRDTLTCMLDLDPFACMDTETKVQLKQTGGIVEIDYIISANIQQYVMRAMEEDKAFISKPYPEKRKVMEKYAMEAQVKINGVTVACSVSFW